VSIWRLALKEILFRKVSFALALVSVAAACGCLVGALVLLDMHDLRTREVLRAKELETQRQMAELEDSMRKAMLGLGFNVVILPQGQKLGDWYAEDSSTSYMKEEYVETLSRSKIVTVQHLLPTLQARVKWPETKRTIILVGTRGEIPGSTARKPMVQAVPPTKIILGYELHDSLGLKAGDKLKLMGREFTVHQCYPMRGNKDDITAWVELGTAQEMLDKKGLINAILALECECAWADLAKVREEITRALPGTQVIERGSEALARAEARRKVGQEAKAAIEREARGRADLRAQRERLASILVPMAMLAAAVWVMLLALGNVRDRRTEIGLLRAIGVRSRQILLLFLSRAVIVGLVGGAIGVAAGFLVGRAVGGSPGAGAGAALAFRWTYAALAMALAPVLAAAASWVPAMLAAQQDPAAILREE
jgi:ABC-type lipoprotein release transport system permease subunit